MVHDTPMLPIISELSLLMDHLIFRDFRKRRPSNTSMDEDLHRSRKPRKVKAQAFYPCPPPAAELGPDSDSSDDDDLFGRLDMLVSKTPLQYLHVA